MQGAVDFLQANKGNQEFANSFGTQIEAGLEPGAALHFSSLAFLGRSLNRDMANMLTGLKTFLNLFGGPFASQLFGLVQRNAVRNVRAGRPAFAIGGSDVAFNEIGGALPAMRSAEIENLQNTTSAMGGFLSDEFQKVRDVASGILGNVRGFATGGDAFFTSPSLISVAENGPEHVSVRGAGRSGSGVTNNFTFAGPMWFNDISRGKMARMMLRDLERAQSRQGAPRRGLGG